MRDREPGQVRKEAALSGAAYAQWGNLAGASGSVQTLTPRFDDGCTVRSSTMAKRDPEQVVRLMAEIWNSGEIEPYLALFAPEIVFLSSESWPAWTGPCWSVRLVG